MFKSIAFAISMLCSYHAGAVSLQNQAAVDAEFLGGVKDLFNKTKENLKQKFSDGNFKEKIKDQVEHIADEIIGEDLVDGVQSTFSAIKNKEGIAKESIGLLGDIMTTDF